MRAGMGIQPPRRQDRQGGRKDTVGYALSGMDGHSASGACVLQTLKLLGDLGVLAVLSGSGWGGG